MQTKKQSFIESITNVIVGYSIAVISQIIIFPYFDVNIKITDNMIIGIWMTAVSIARSYIIRRLFNGNIFMVKTKYTICSTYRGVYIITELKTLFGYEISYKDLDNYYPLTEAGYQWAEQFIENKKNL